MRLQTVVLLVILLATGAAIYRQGLARAPQPQCPSPKTQSSPAVTVQANPNQEINDRFVKQLSERIAGRENEPSEKVFKNIQWLKGTPAGRFLRIMNAGYSRALGVSCTHCHVEQDFASDDKRPKRAAREMALMHRGINDQLAKMQNLDLKPEQRFINCSTCHRGAINPVASDR